MTLEGMGITTERLDVVRTISLLSILVMAVGSYFTLKNTVDTLKDNVKDATEARETAVDSLRTQNMLLRELFSKSQERMAIIETKLDGIKEQQGKLADQVETIIMNQRGLAR